MISNLRKDSSLVLRLKLQSDSGFESELEFQLLDPILWELNITLDYTGLHVKKVYTHSGTSSMQFLFGVWPSI